MDLSGLPGLRGTERRDGDTRRHQNCSNAATESAADRTPRAQSDGCYGISGPEDSKRNRNTTNLNVTNPIRRHRQGKRALPFLECVDAFPELTGMDQ